MNPAGYPATLRAAHPQNQNAAKHGIYSAVEGSGRVLAPRAREISDAIMASDFASGFDVIGAEEVGALLALIEKIDAELDARGVIGRGGAPSGLLKLRFAGSRRLQEWLAAYGLTPRTRAELISTLTAGSIAEDMARRRGTAA